MSNIFVYVFIVTFFHSVGIELFVIYIPWSPILKPANPNITDCSTPPAPVKKYGLDPPLV